MTNNSTLPKELQLLIEQESKKSVARTMRSQGYVKDSPEPPKTLIENTKSKVMSGAKKVFKTLLEGFTLVERPYKLKTEKLSEEAKQSHQKLYKKYIEMFNKVSVAGDVANREEANSNSSAFRTLKTDETFLLNAIKLHELYFSNISDLVSEITVDSLPFMRLSRDFGTFENFQFDFMAAAESCRNGWVITVFEPYRDRYMNIVVDGHNVGLPVGAIPIIVLDMWEHAYYHDYCDDKKSYITSMMKEINWNVVEARMLVAERTDINTLYQIQAVDNTVPDEMLAMAQTADGLAPPPDTQPSQVPDGPLVQSPLNSNDNPRKLNK